MVPCSTKSRDRDQYALVAPAFQPDLIRKAPGELRDRQIQSLVCGRGGAGAEENAHAQEKPSRNGEEGGARYLPRVSAGRHGRMLAGVSPASGRHGW